MSDETEGYKVTTAMAAVIAERRRQVDEEGWTPEHDDGHTCGELADAAACYALYGIGTTRAALPGWVSAWAKFWPWDTGWWKPKDRRRDLVRAAALLVAEIERLDRVEATARRRQPQMSDETRDDSGPAFPPEHTPLTPIEYAAIHLCVPCGTDWLDKMIERARRERVAGMQMAALTANVNCDLPAYQAIEFCYAQADAMLAHSDEGGE